MGLITWCAHAGSGQGSKSKGLMGPSRRQQRADKAPSALEAALQCQEDLADDAAAAAASPGNVHQLHKDAFGTVRVNHCLLTRGCGACATSLARKAVGAGTALFCVEQLLHCKAALPVDLFVLLFLTLASFL